MLADRNVQVFPYSFRSAKLNLISIFRPFSSCRRNAKFVTMLKKVYEIKNVGRLSSNKILGLLSEDNIVEWKCQNFGQNDEISAHFEKWPTFGGQTPQENWQRLRVSQATNKFNEFNTIFFIIIFTKSNWNLVKLQSLGTFTSRRDIL